MSVSAYHPETGASYETDEDQLAHMRASGWMLRSEWEANQAAAAEAAQAAEGAPRGPAPKTAKADEAATGDKAK